MVASAPARIKAIPAGRVDYTLADEALEFVASECGMRLDDWQQEVLRESLGLRKDGSWAAKEVGLNVPRQNGKGTVLEARELVGLFMLGEQMVIHSAHEFATSQEHFRRIEATVRDNPGLLEQVRWNRGDYAGFRHGHGEAGIELGDGRRLIFKTRSKSGSRGFSGNVMVFDEAMVFTRAALAAMMPILRTRSMASDEFPHGMQIWYAGSAVDQDIHEHGLVWTAVRERGLDGNDPTLAYFEWSVDVDHPSQVTDEMALDDDLRRQANPALGIRIAPEHMDLEYRSMDLRSFAVELYGAGDYPSLDGQVQMVISPEDWAALTDAGSALEDPVCLAFDVSPERKTAIVAAGLRPDGLFHVEVIQHKQGTGWVPERLEELVARWDVHSVVCDGYGPAASVASAVEELGVKLSRVTAGEHGQACGHLVDVVAENRLRHLGSEELAAALRGAKPRPLGDAWAWSRKNSSHDISPLVAATLALHAAVGLEVGELAIF
jgi:hypothetical protein